MNTVRWMEMAEELVKDLRSRGFQRNYFRSLAGVYYWILKIVEALYLMLVKPPSMDKVITNNSFSVDQCRVISLDSREDRKRDIREQFDREGVDFMFESAVNGRTLNMDSIPPQLLTEVTRSQLKPGQIGCYLSHIILWTKMLTSEWEHLLVIEDDAKLTTDFKQQVAHYFNEVPTDYDLFFVGGCGKVYNRKRVSKHVAIPYNIACTHGYIVSRKGCEKMLTYSSSHPRKRPIDLVMSELIKVRAINAYVAEPFLCFQGEEHGSDIDTDG